jgi:hypothetical protein
MNCDLCGQPCPRPAWLEEKDPGFALWPSGSTCDPVMCLVCRRRPRYLNIEWHSTLRDRARIWA